MAGDQSIVPVTKMVTSEMASLPVKIALKTPHPCSLIHKAFELSQKHCNTAPQVGQYVNIKEERNWVNWETLSLNKQVLY